MFGCSLIFKVNHSVPILVFCWCLRDWRMQTYVPFYGQRRELNLPVRCTWYFSTKIPFFQDLDGEKKNFEKTFKGSSPER